MIMAAKAAKAAWASGTTIVYTTELSGLVWKGEVVEEDGIWRRIRWEEGYAPAWLGVERLNKRAKKLTQQRVKTTPAPKPTPRRKPKDNFTDVLGWEPDDR